MDAGDASDLDGCNRRMTAKMTSNASSEAVNHFLHVNSQRRNGGVRLTAETPVSKPLIRNHGSPKTDVLPSDGQQGLRRSVLHGYNKGSASFLACASEDPLLWVPLASVILALGEQGLMKLHGPRRPSKLHRRFSQCFGCDLLQGSQPCEQYYTFPKTIAT
ncbi:hypothetical protein M513_10693 [Trichuris suis]|uniref:Uncharacterized protein n=1 Tax=Trichuris suis TaxID=68888 RepID=A0A085LU25_9BILA|nr:hypothetical protein M513_10689 [Trichuris suis]KFD48475.1 hypothetical protein M513_10693 [Trichuris suis]